MAAHVNTSHSLRDLKPGMVIGRVVLKDNGKILLAEGTVLTDRIIDLLDIWNIRNVFIREQASGSDIELGPANMDEAIGFYHAYYEAVDYMKNVFVATRRFKKVAVEQMLQLVAGNIRPLVNSVGALFYLNMGNSPEDYTYHHSVRVAIVAGMLGKWLGYERETLDNLLLAGLIHDIGKAEIPPEILSKPDKLTEQEMAIIKLHSSYGAQLIQSAGSPVPPDVILGVLQHHERMDGSGYPHKAPGIKIHSFARIIAIADIYDAMTSDRPFKGKETPFSVVDVLSQEMFNKLDPDFCTTFLNNLRDSLLGVIVQLSDGREAEVVYLGEFLAARPVVRTKDGEFICLDRRKDICISKVIGLQVASSMAGNTTHSVKEFMSAGYR